jgi:peptidylprolyl isomerase
LPQSRRNQTRQRRGQSPARTPSTARPSGARSASSRDRYILLSLALVAVAAAIYAYYSFGRSRPGELVTTPSGLKYKDEVIGSGASPQSGREVKVHYTGRLEQGTKFDSSVDRNQPYSFTLGRGVVIPGWEEGILGMRVGGKRQLIIPPHLGYGARGRPPTIPPNATLVFDLELLEVK